MKVKTRIWLKQSFSTTQYQHGDGYLKIAFSGISNGVFGIDKREGLFFITHLRTGWLAFICRTESSAKEIADYLTANYFSLFEKIRVCGSEVENAVELRKQIFADAKLKRLTRAFALNRRERNRLDLTPEARPKFLS